MDIMSKLFLLIKYAFLGLFQGITEPLPISSSGHIVILRDLFGIYIEGLSFEVIVNFGSLIAVMLVYRRDIIRIVKNSLTYMFKRDITKQTDFHFCLMLIIATIPTGIIGLLFEDFISHKLSTVTVVGVTLLITGLALWIIRNLTGDKEDVHITIKDALIVGLAQSVALIPGISRSGATIVAAMLVGMKRKTALRFSFLLYIPVSFGVTALSVGDIVRDEQFQSLFIPYVIAWLAAIVATFYALKWFMNIMMKGRLKYFTYYCFVIGILVILLM